MRDHDQTCPNRANHTPCPEGYIQWHAWAEKMGKTHYQVTCHGCGRYAIWVPKSERHEMTKPAAAKHARPCPRCKAEYPVVVPLWRWLKGDYRHKTIIQICTACGIAGHTSTQKREGSHA